MIRKRYISLFMISLAVANVSRANLLQHDRPLMASRLLNTTITDHSRLNQFKQQAQNLEGNGPALPGFTCPNPSQIHIINSKNMGLGKAVANPTANMPPALGKWAS